MRHQVYGKENFFLSISMEQCYSILRSDAITNKLFCFVILSRDYDFGQAVFHTNLLKRRTSPNVYFLIYERLILLTPKHDYRVLVAPRRIECDTYTDLNRVVL